MLFGNDRSQMRRFFFEAWRKHQAGAPLSPLESLIAQVIEHHPEYHALLADPQADLEKDYSPDIGQSNPFLHLGLHLALAEQLATDRPRGIQTIYQRLCHHLGDSHEAEHRMLDCLGETLWEAQRGDQPPDEQRYLVRLRQQLSQH